MERVVIGTGNGVQDQILHGGMRDKLASRNPAARLGTQTEARIRWWGSIFILLIKYVKYLE